MNRLLESETSVLCEKMLDFTARRSKVLAHNVANMNTPGFRRSDVKFSDDLERVLRDKGIEGVRNLGFRIVKEENTPIRNDGNDAPIEKEMAMQAENAIQYQIYAQLLSRRFRSIREILKEA